MKLLLATGNTALDAFIESKRKGYFSSFAVVKTCRTREEIFNYINAFTYAPCECILLGSALSGDVPLVTLCKSIKMRFPNIRVVYLAGEVDLNDTYRRDELGELVKIGIYDLCTAKSITPTALQELLLHPMCFDDVKNYVAHLLNPITEVEQQQFTPVEETPPQESCDNVVTFSSIKPGSGKSFVASNVACAIASKGIKSKGEAPRVALIEADLQNPSVGTLLNMPTDATYNVRTVMEQISTVVSKNGVISDNMVAHKKVREFLLSALLPYPQIPNLFVLNGSDLKVEEINEGCNMHYYSYLINCIKPYFDIVLVDTNSSLYHKTSLGVLSAAKICYYVITLSYHSLNSNVNYLDTLKELGVYSKTRFILNQDVTDVNKQYTGTDLEELEFKGDELSNSQLNPEDRRIPALPQAVMLNREFRGKPLVLDENNSVLRPFQLPLFSIANEIWPIQGLEAMYKQAEKDKKSNKHFWIGGKR